MKKLIAPIFLLLFAAIANAQDFSQLEKNMLSTVCGLATSSPTSATDKKLAQLIDQSIREKACEVLKTGREGNEQFVEFIARQFQTANGSSSDDASNANGGGKNPNKDNGIHDVTPNEGSSKDSKSNLKPKSQPNPDLFPKPSAKTKTYQTDTHPLLKQPERVALQEACSICKKSQTEAALTPYEKAFIDFMNDQIGEQAPQELCEFGGQKNYACYVLEAASGQDGKVGYEDFINKVMTVRNYLKSIK